MPPSEKTPADEQKIESTKEPLRSRIAYTTEPVDVALSDITVGQSFYINGDDSVLLTQLDLIPNPAGHRDAMLITITEPYHITDNGKLNLRGIVLAVNPGEGFRNTVTPATYHTLNSLGLTDAMEGDARLPQIPKPISISIPITGVKLDQALIARAKPWIVRQYSEAIDQLYEDKKERAIARRGELPGSVDSVATKKKSEKLATKAAAGKAKSLEDRADNQLLSSTKPPAKTRATKAEMIARSLDERLRDLKALNLPKGEYAVTYEGAMAARGLRKTYFTEVITSDSLWETLSKKHKVQEGYNGGHFIDIGPRVTVYGPGHPVRDGVPVEKQLAGAEMIGDIPFVSLGDLHTILLTGTSAKDPNDIKLIDAYQAKTAVKTKKTPGIVKAGTTDAPKVKGLLAGSTNVSGFFPNATAASGSPVPGAKVVSKIPKATATNLEPATTSPVPSATLPPAKTRATKAETIAKSLDEVSDDLKALNLPKGQYAVTYQGAMAARGLRKTGFTDVITSDSLWETLSKKYTVEEGYKGGQSIDAGPTVTVYGPGYAIRDVVPVEKQIAGAEMIGGVPFVSLSDFHTVLLAYDGFADPDDVKLIKAHQAKTAAKAKKTPGIVKAGTTNAPKAKGLLAGNANVSGFFPNATAADGSPVSGTKVVSEIPKATVPAAKPARIGAGFFGKLDDLKALNLPEGQYAVTSSGAMAAHGIREANDVDVVVSPYLWDALSRKHPVTRDGDFQKILIGDHTEILGPGSHFVDGRIAPMSAQLKGAELIGGVPFVNLRMVSAFKTAAGRAKDLADVGLIDAYRKRQMGGLKVLAAGIKAVHDTHREEFVPSTIAGYALGPIMGPAAAIPETTHVLSTPVTSATAGLSNPAGTASFVFAPKSKQDLRKRKEKALPVVSRGDAPGTVKAGKAFSGKNESRIASTVNVVEFFPGITTLEEMYKYVAAAKPSGAGDFKIDPDLEDAVKLHEKDLSHLKAVAKLFNEGEVAKVYANIQKYNLPSDISKNSIIHDMLRGVSSVSTKDSINFKKRRLASEIVREEETLNVLMKEYGRQIMALSETAEREKSLAVMRNTVAQIKADLRFGQRSLGSKSAGKRFSSGKKFLPAGVRSVSTAVNVTMPSYKPAGLEGMTQTEYLDNMISEKVTPSYSTLVRHPSRRNGTATLSAGDQRNLTNAIESYDQAWDVAGFTKRIKDKHSFKGSAAGGSYASMQGLGSGEWFHLFQTNPLTRKANTDGTVDKGYLTFKDPLKDITIDNIVDFHEKLASAGFEGQIKVHAHGARTYSQFDNIVMHGQNLEDVNIAFQVARDHFGDQIEYYQRGVDIPNHSYTQHLQQYATDLIEGKPLSVPSLPVLAPLPAGFNGRSTTLRSVTAWAPYTSAQGSLSSATVSNVPGSKSIASSVSPINTSTSEKRYTSKGNRYVGALAKDRVRKVRMGLIVSHGLVEANGEFAEANGQAGLLVSRPATKKELEGGILHHQLLTSGMYEMDSEAMLESMILPTKSYAKTPGVKSAGLGEFEEMRYFISHGAASRIHEMNSGVLAFMFRRYTSDNSRDQGDGTGALESFLAKVNEFRENRALTESTIFGETNSVYNAGKEKEAERLRLAQLARRNRADTTAKPKPEPREKSMVGALARQNETRQQLASAGTFEEMLALNQKAAEIEHGKLIAGLFATVDNTELIAVLEKKLETAVSVSEIASLNKRIAGLQAASTVKTLHSRFNALVVNKRELKIGEAVSVGQMSDGNSSIARETNKGRIESSQKGAEEHYEVPTVTFNEMLARYKDPVMQIDGLSTAEFFQKHARNTPKGIFWNNSAMLVKDVASPGTITVSARLIPGSLHSGKMTVDSEFYKSLFKLPSNKYLPKDSTRLAPLYESISEVNRLRETTIKDSKGLPLSETALQTIQALDKREDRVRLDIRRIRNAFALTQDVQLSEDSIPLRKLQKALIQIPELKEMLLLGGTGSVKDDKFTVAYGAGRFDDYLKKLGTTNTKNLKGIKDINLEIADISKRYLGGARFDPIELLTQSQKTAFAMNDELAYQTTAKGYVDGINSHGELAPGISDLLEFMQKKPLQYNPANPREGVRDLVTNLFSSRTVPQSVQAGSLERTSQEGNQYSLAIDSGSNTQADALNNMLGSKAEEEAKNLTPEFRSARDFFGKVSASTSEDIGYEHSASFETARDVLIGNYSDMPLDSEDKNAYLKRKGFFFGYKSGTVAGIQSAEPLTAREYNNKESVNTIVPSKETFKEISKLTPSQQKVMGSRIGIPFGQADFVPIDTAKGSPAGFQDLQTMLMSKELLPLDSKGIMVDPDSIPLSRAQQQIIEHVFRPALLDGLELDKDTQEHTAELEKYLKDPMTLRLPAMTEPSESDLRKAAAERESAFIRAEDLALKKRVMNATPEAINEAVGAFVRGTQRSYQIKHSTGSLNVEFTEDDASMVTVNGVNYSFDASTVIASGSAIDKELKSGVIAEGFSPKIKADEELAPIRQLVAGENRMIISPEMGSAGTHATLEKMLHKMNNGGATIIGFDIETEIEYARDKQGKILLDEDGEKKIDHSTVLHNVGSTTFTLTPDGVVDKTDGFDVSAVAFTKSKTAEAALGVGSIGRTVGKGHFGSEEENMVSFVFDKFSAADKDAFFGVFNATFDVGHMADYARDAINARLASIKEAEGKGMFNNSALKEQLDYFQKAHTFFKDEMPGRTVELSHLLEISGVQRTAAKRANSLEEFLIALKILERGDQVHGGKQDIDDAILGVHKSVSEFTGGKALNLESFSFDGKTAGAQQYVFPMHLKYEIENDKIKARFPKAPFVLDGLVEKTITKPDGTLQQVVAMVGSKIDGNNERIGPSEIQGFHYRGSVIQQMATQDTRKDAYFITDLEHIDEGWKKTRSRENLRELIERNVRRATRYEGRGRGEADFGKRDQYEAKAAIAQEYEKKLGVSKVAAEAYITDVIKDLTETNESGPHYVKRPELQPLARASGDGKGTIDTSSAKKAFSFIRAEDAKIVKDWLLSGDTNKFGEAGFMMPHARATIIETAAVLKEREANHDAIFMDTFHEAGRTGIIAPEQIRSASAMYRSIMETSYSKAEQEIEGPATATIISTQQGRQKMTRLNGKMSQEEIYDALFDHSLTVTGRVQDVLDATGKDYSFDVPTAQEMANAKNPSTEKARKLIKERNAKLDPNVVKKMESDSEFTANELSEETQKVLEARNGKLNELLVQGIQDDVRVSAPELSGIGIGSQHQSLRSLANEIHQLLSSSSRKVKVAEDLYSGPLFTASGEEANYEHMATTFGAAIGMDLPKDKAAMATWAKSQENMQELYYAMEKTMGQGAYRTTDYDSKMPEMYTPEDTSLKNALKGIEKPTVTRFARRIEYSESGKAELIANTMNEQYAESILENEKRAIRKAENKLSPMKIGGGLGALALAAFAAETISDMGEAAKDRENDSVVGQPRSTTAHNAGPLDTELNQKGSDSNTAANQGWSRLHIDIELEHPGYAGSDKRLDTEALKAFSDDVGSTLSRHFDATPTYTSSQSSNQDNSLRYRVGDMLNRSSGRYR